MSKVLVIAFPNDERGRTQLHSFQGQAHINILHGWGSDVVNENKREPATFLLYKINHADDVGVNEPTKPIQASISDKMVPASSQKDDTIK